MGGRTRAALVACLMVATVLVVGAPSVGAQGPTCNGLAATVVGTEGNDVLLGTEGPDVMVGLGGNDILRGFGGNDTMCGDNGRDRLFGGMGNDDLFGGRKNDILKGDQGRDELFGNQGNDRLFGGGSVDMLEGGSGTRDRLFGKGGSDTCSDPQGTTFVNTCEILDIRLPATLNQVHQFYSQTVNGVMTNTAPANALIQPGTVSSFWYRVGGVYAIFLSGLNPQLSLCPGNSIQTTATTFENVTNSPMNNGLCGDTWPTATMQDTGVYTCQGFTSYLTEIPVTKTGNLWSSLNWVIGTDTSASGDTATLVAVVAVDLATTAEIDRSIMSC
ncbi:MAG: calcium-binding protein [Acidimicrobiales bacterium]